MPIETRKEIEALAAFDGRVAGSDAERRAARHLERRLHALGREAETEPVWVHPDYPLAHVIHAVFGIAASLLSVSQPFAGAALALVAAISAFGDISGTFLLLRRLTPRRASQNVTSEEDRGKPGVLVLTAHYDAERTARGLELFFWSIVAILACTALRVAGIEGTPLTAVQFVPTVVLIASIPLLVDTALSRAGSVDNAPGVATALRLAERFGGRLEHFDVWVVLPGAAGGLLLGMRAWMRRRRRGLDPQRTVFLNLETGAAGDPVRWVVKEGRIVRVRYHPELIRMCEEDGEGEPARSRGAGDAVVARATGFPAVTVVVGDLDEAYGFCCRLVERLDREVGPDLS